jgi:ferredoxin like protein
VRLSIPEKTARNKYELDEKPHIRVDSSGVCASCAKKPCTTVCPAGVYTYDAANGAINVDHAGCLECGTCVVACVLGGLTWEYPVGGFGILYRYA